MAKIKIEIKHILTGSLLFSYESETATIKEALISAVKDGANLDGANLYGANLYGANLTRANLDGANLYGANLDGANLYGASLTRANLDGANLTRANLTRASLYGANLDGANLDGANLDGASLTRANLDGASLTRANLDGANLDGANLDGANLYGANLYGANLTRANLDGASLTRANLDGANLTPYKEDLFLVLLRAIPEVQYLRANIIDGKIDGSTYEGSCSCLSGTLYRGATEHNGQFEKLIKDKIISVRSSSRPIEMFFALIKKGDTPETNIAAKLALEWVDEFIEYITPKK